MKTHASRVLIVDDDEGVTQTFARALALEGYEVRTASNAEAGLREAEALPPDAIILDLRMPLINGVGFLYRLRERAATSATPVAIITGDQCLNDEVLGELASLGAEIRYKPLWLEDLIDLARTMLSGGMAVQTPVPVEVPARTAPQAAPR